jgi:hypothetical protein
LLRIVLLRRARLHLLSADLECRPLCSGLLANRLLLAWLPGGLRSWLIWAIALWLLRDTSSREDSPNNEWVSVAA